MTLETRKKRLEIAKKHNDSKEIEFWEARIKKHPDYKEEAKEEPQKEVKKRGKTKKR